MIRGRYEALSVSIVLSMKIAISLHKIASFFFGSPYNRQNSPLRGPKGAQREQDAIRYVRMGMGPRMREKLAIFYNNINKDYLARALTKRVLPALSQQEIKEWAAEEQRVASDGPVKF